MPALTLRTRVGRPDPARHATAFSPNLRRLDRGVRAGGVVRWVFCDHTRNASKRWYLMYSAPPPSPIS